MWETMAFGERPYWDWSNFEVGKKYLIFLAIISISTEMCDTACVMAGDLKS